MPYKHLEIVKPKGVNFSIEPSQLEDNVWDYVEEVAFRHGNTKKVIGYEAGFGSTGNIDPNKQGMVVPEAIVPLRDGAEKYYWWVYSAIDKERDKDGDKDVGTIYQVQSVGVHRDVTPRDSNSNSLIPINELYRWTGDSINGTPYVTHAKPYLWIDTDNKFVPMPLFPNHIKVDNIRTYRNYMIGLNFITDDFDNNKTDEDWLTWGASLIQSDGETDEEYLAKIKKYGSTFGSWSGVQQQHQTGIWWSDEVMGNGVVNSPWSDADPTKSSGWNLLGGAGGIIIDGKTLRDSFIIYREHSIWQMNYIGGINIFAFKELFNDIGVLGINCVTEIDGWHFVVGQSDIYMHNGIQKNSVADGVIRKRIFDTIDPAYSSNVFLTVAYNDKEVWVCIPEVDTNINGDCNVAYVYNWEEKTWSMRKIPNIKCSMYTIMSISTEDMSWCAISEGGDGNIDNPQPLPPPYIDGSTWEESHDSWLSSNFNYNASMWGLLLGGSSYSSKIVNSEIEYTFEGGYLYTSIDSPMLMGENFNATVEKRWLDMGDNQLYKTINRIYPLVRGGVIEVYVGGSSNTTKAPVWVYAGIFDPATNMSVGCRATGRFLHVKFIIPKTSRAEIKGFTVDYTVGGVR